MRIFPTPPFTLAPLRHWWGGPKHEALENSEPIRMRAGDKLALLRRLDPAGNWTGLDDKRRCARCGMIFNGRQIDVVGGTRALGPLRLLCPTENCHGNPRDWVMPDLGPRAAARSAPGFREELMAAPPLLSEYGTVVPARRRRRGKRARARAGKTQPAPDLESEAMKRIIRLLHPIKTRS